MKNILLIATGGTIASKDNGNGLTPVSYTHLLENLGLCRLLRMRTGHVKQEDIILT